MLVYEMTSAWVGMRDPYGSCLKIQDQKTTRTTTGFGVRFRRARSQPLNHVPLRRQPLNEANGWIANWIKLGKNTSSDDRRLMMTCQWNSVWFGMLLNEGVPFGAFQEDGGSFLCCGRRWFKPSCIKMGGVLNGAFMRAPKHPKDVTR